MNSFKSACNFAKCTSMALNQLEKNVHSLIGREIGVELIVCLISSLKTVEKLDTPFHR